MAGEEAGVLQPLPLAGLRLGVPRGVLFTDTEHEIGVTFEECIRKLKLTGVQVSGFGIDDLLAGMRAATQRASIAAMEGAEIHADWLAAGANTQVDPHVSGPLSRAATIAASVYIRTLRKRLELVAAMDECLAGFDAFVLPTVPILAPTISAMTGDEKARSRAEGLLLRNTQIANQFDLCAISLPMPGTSLPAGLMLVARRGHDRRLLAMAATVETLLAQ
jgi:aspartyl-tRNA(Asn)/glutamyl-tRNA(Gln) amidotransferase subunit A